MEMLFGQMKETLLTWYLSKKGHRLSKKIPYEKMEEPIDFLVAWVDGSDPKWKAEKEKYQREIGIFKEHKDNGEERYRDWDIFQYWFRAVEKYAPWVRNIYLVTEGHLPEWLNENAPKLKIVKHTDYIPHEYLPTFNANVIELNFNRIEGLAEHFVYFNDDMFLARPCAPEDFFRGGKPLYTALTKPLHNRDNGAFSHMNFVVLGAINNAFAGQASRIMKKHPELWFHKSYGYWETWNMKSFKAEYMQGMFFSHLAAPFRKSTFEKMWEVFPGLMHETSKHRFRTAQDGQNQLVSFWDIMNGDFYPVPMEHHGRAFFRPMLRLDDIRSAIYNQNHLCICVNDSEYVTYDDFQILKSFLGETFAKQFPEKSSFEK